MLSSLGDEIRDRHRGNTGVDATLGSDRGGAVAHHADVQGGAGTGSPPAATGSSMMPFVTLTFAQCLDGSIATASRGPVRISCDDSMLMTHHLRAMYVPL